MLTTSVGRNDRASRLSAARLAEIKQIAAELLMVTGYENFTFDQLARNARCSKSTLYRHWKGKQGLVADVMDRNVLKVVDTGTLREDLRAFVISAAHGLAVWGPVFLSLAWAAGKDEEVAATWRDATRRTAQAQLSLIVQRGVDRGEIPPPKDLELLSTVIPASFVWHFAFNKGCDPKAFAERFLEEVIMPFLSAPA